MLQQIKQSIQNKLRYAHGYDNLNRFLLYVLLVLSIGSIFFNNFYSFIGYFILFPIIVFRFFSKNYRKRTTENQVYLRAKRTLTKPVINLFQYLVDLPKFKYFNCPTCRATIRIPRKKGQVNITCPKCKSQFLGKS
ncbi:MAG: hypothetical protein ACRC6X_08565 [Culicoidibacterales bacterium]